MEVNGRRRSIEHIRYRTETFTLRHALEVIHTNVAHVQVIESSAVSGGEVDRIRSDGGDYGIGHRHNPVRVFVTGRGTKVLTLMPFAGWAERQI